MVAFEYIRPGTLNEALDFLAANGPDTKILAGGTDLVVGLRSGDIRPKYVLDVNRLEELKGIRLTGEGICVGSGVTISEIYTSSLLQSHAPALKKSALTFASLQVRNVATIGGNVANCSPCGDTLPPLVIHEAKAVLACKTGRREVPVEQIASGPYNSSLPPGELIIRFVLKPAENVWLADFQKIGRRKELAIARINMAAMAGKDPDGRVSSLRFCLGSCTPTPRRMTVVEEFLTGKVPSEALLWKAGRLMTDRMFEITGRRASAVYKEPAIQGLFVRMLYPLVQK